MTPGFSGNSVSKSGPHLAGPVPRWRFHCRTIDSGMYSRPLSLLFALTLLSPLQTSMYFNTLLRAGHDPLETLFFPATVSL